MTTLPLLYPSLNLGFDSPIIERAMTYAVTCHSSTNHYYNTHPYSFHLQMVYNIGCNYAHLLAPEEREPALAACWVHDTIEDCRQTYNDVKKSCGEQVANIAYALTNEKGRNRKERANNRYYEGIRSTPCAVFVKLCDRLANVSYSKESGSSMLDAYRTENESFIEKMGNHPYPEMVEALKEMVR